MNVCLPDAIIEIHFKVREIINNLFKNTKGLKVLDAAAGNGYMTEWLLGKGFEVVALDICTENWMVPAVKCNFADLNKDIPLAENSFDLVLSIETIEHLENPFHFIKELSRITKPNGIIIITTPNVHSTRSRLKYLFLGYSTLFEYSEGDNIGREHISPVSIGQFLYAFKNNNLKLFDLYTTGPKHPFILSMLFEFINIFTLLGLKLLKIKRGFYPAHYINILSYKQLKELNRKVALIVVAQKHR